MCDRFLAPKFRFGTGLTIKVQKLASNKMLSEDESMAKNLEPKPLSSLGDYLGQVGLAEWVESLRDFLLA
jgi:hypothetical protein